MKTLVSVVALASFVLASGCTDRETLFGTSAPPIGATAKRTAVRDSLAVRGAALASDASDDDDAAHTSVATNTVENGPTAPGDSDERDDDASNGWIALGDDAMAHHRPAEALTAFERALAVDPDDGWALVRASDALVAMGRSAEARARLRAFVSLHSDTVPDVFDALGWLEIDERNPASAATAFQKALDVSKENDADAWYGLAVLAADANDATQVERTLGRVFALDPQRREEARADEAFALVRQSPEWARLFAPPSH